MACATTSMIRDVLRWMAMGLADALSCAAWAGQGTVPPLATTDFLDTETATNVAIRCDGQVDDVKIEFRLGEAVSNCVQIAFGVDGNTNGVLDVEETDAVFGWRNGVVFAEDFDREGRRESLRVEEDVGSSRSLIFHFALSSDGAVRHFDATSDGRPVLTNLSASVQSWAYCRVWNMLRVTRRGAAEPSEWLTFRQTSRGVLIFLR